VRDVLVWTHDNHATSVSIYATHYEDVRAVFEVWTEHLFVVEKSVTPFPGQKERGHSLKREIAMLLLKDRAYVNH